ncbi:hypothetical protein KDK77_08505, partial [bacterium]|nr:hypothetical protein [bacterium]
LATLTQRYEQLGFKDFRSQLSNMDGNVDMIETYRTYDPFRFDAVIESFGKIISRPFFRQEKELYDAFSTRISAVNQRIEAAQKALDSQTRTIRQKLEYLNKQHSKIDEYVTGMTRFARSTQFEHDRAQFSIRNELNEARLVKQRGESPLDRIELKLREYAVLNETFQTEGLFNARAQSLSGQELKDMVLALIPLRSALTGAELPATVRESIVASRQKTYAELLKYVMPVLDARINEIGRSRRVFADVRVSLANAYFQLARTLQEVNIHDESQMREIQNAMSLFEFIPSPLVRNGSVAFKDIDWFRLLNNADFREIAQSQGISISVWTREDEQLMNRLEQSQNEVDVNVISNLAVTKFDIENASNVPIQGKTIPALILPAQMTSGGFQRLANLFSGVMEELGIPQGDYFQRNDMLGPYNALMRNDALLSLLQQFGRLNEEDRRIAMQFIKVVFSDGIVKLAQSVIDYQVQQLENEQANLEKIKAAVVRQIDELTRPPLAQRVAQGVTRFLPFGKQRSDAKRLLEGKKEPQILALPSPSADQKTDQELEEFIENRLAAAFKLPKDKKPPMGPLKAVGDEDAEQVDSAIIQQWVQESERAQLQNITVNDANGQAYTIPAFFIESNLLPESMNAFHIKRDGKPLIIVTRSAAEIIPYFEEAVFHEMKEAIWIQQLSLGKADIRPDLMNSVAVMAHIAANAEQVMAFGVIRDVLGNVTYQLTPYHAAQIEALRVQSNTEKLTGLLNEDRQYQNNLVENLFDVQTRGYIENYERHFKAAVFLALQSISFEKSEKQSIEKHITNEQFKPLDLKDLSHDSIVMGNADNDLVLKIAREETSVFGSLKFDNHAVTGLALEVLGDLIPSTLDISGMGINVDGQAVQIGYIQQRMKYTVQEALRILDEQNDTAQMRALIDKVFTLWETMWQRGVVDVDLMFFRNMGLNSLEELDVKLFDFGKLTTERMQIFRIQSGFSEEDIFNSYASVLPASIMPYIRQRGNTLADTDNIIINKKKWRSMPPVVASKVDFIELPAFTGQDIQTILGMLGENEYIADFSQLQNDLAEILQRKNTTHKDVPIDVIAAEVFGKSLQVRVDSVLNDPFENRIAADFYIPEDRIPPSGALKAVGDEDAEQIDPALRSQWIDFARLQVPAVRNVAGLNGNQYAIEAIYLELDTLPVGVNAYHIQETGFPLIIVTRPGIEQTEYAGEAAFHEYREAAWISAFMAGNTKITPIGFEQIAGISHILAAADQVKAFGVKQNVDGTVSYQLTPYHQAQIAELVRTGNRQKLLQLFDEDRSGHYELIENYLDEESRAISERYELLFKTAVSLALGALSDPQNMLNDAEVRSILDVLSFYGYTGDMRNLHADIVRIWRAKASHPTIPVKAMAVAVFGVPASHEMTIDQSDIKSGIDLLANAFDGITQFTDNDIRQLVQLRAESAMRLYPTQSGRIAEFARTLPKFEETLTAAHNLGQFMDVLVNQLDRDRTAPVLPLYLARDGDIFYLYQQVLNPAQQGELLPAGRTFLDELTEDVRSSTQMLIYAIEQYLFAQYPDRDPNGTFQHQGEEILEHFQTLYGILIKGPADRPVEEVLAELN